MANHVEVIIYSTMSKMPFFDYFYALLQLNLNYFTLYYFIAKLKNKKGQFVNWPFFKSF